MDKMAFSVKAGSIGTVTTATARGHRLVIDADPGMGGKEMGPNPMETILSALAACESITAGMIAKEMDFDIDGFDFEITAELNPQGVMGNPNVRTYFEKVDIKAVIRTSESEERLMKLRQAVEQRCPAYGMFKAAKVEMTGTWFKA